MTVGAVDCGSGGRLQHVCGLGVDWGGRSRLPRCVAPSAAGCPRYPSLATGARGGFEGSRVGESAVYWVVASCCVRLPSLRPCNAATPELGWRCCMSVLLCSQCPDALASGRQMEWCYPPVHWGRGRVGQPCAAESGGLPMRGRLIDTIRYEWSWTRVPNLQRSVIAKCSLSSCCRRPRAVSSRQVRWAFALQPCAGRRLPASRPRSAWRRKGLSAS